MSFGTNTYTPRPDKPVGRAAPRKQVEKRVLYPEFIEAMQYTDDPEWLATLNNAARGVFANKSLYYEGGFLANRQVRARMKMPDDPKLLAQKFILFHKKHAGINTKKESNTQESARCKVGSSIEPLTWDTCHKSMKMSRLSDYAMRNTQSPEENVELLAVLHVAYDSKKLNDRTVGMTNNTIHTITVINQTPKGVWYVI